MLDLNNNQLYREVVSEHYKNPQNKGLESTLPVFESKNPICGDSVAIQIHFDKNGYIDSVHQQSEGCSISVSSVSILSGLLVGKTRDQAIKLVVNFLNMLRGEEYDHSLDFGDAIVFDNIQDYPARYKCAAVSWELALKVLEDKQNG